MNGRILRVTTAMLVSAGIGLTGLGLASGTAQAEPGPGPLPTHQWCPGNFWDPHWGVNWWWLFCHDDHHRGYGGGRGGRY